MLKKLSKFDVFGQPFSLKAHKTSLTYTTAIGGLITLIWVLLVLLVSYSTLTSYLDTTKPVVSVNRIRLPRPESINIRDHSSGGGFMFFDGKKFLTAEESKRYVTFKGEIATSKKVDGELIHSIKKFLVRPCPELSDEGTKELFETTTTKIESKIDYQALFSDSILCGEINQENSFIEGNKFSLPFSTQDYLIYPCSLPDPAKCASLEELSALQIGLIQLVKVAKYSEKGDPLEPALDPDTVFYVDLTTKTQIVSYYKMNHLYDDDVGIISKRLTQEFINVDKVKTVTGSRLTQSAYCSEQQIATGFCEYYTKIINRSSNEKMVIERRYKQFFGVISEIGGFNDLIILILWVFYFFYNSYSYKKMIRSQLDASLSEFWESKAESNSGRDLELEGENFKIRKKKEESSQKSIEKLNQKLEPVPEVVILTEINAKSKIFIEAIFDNFNKNLALEALLPKIIFNRKKKQEKSQEKHQDDALDLNPLNNHSEEFRSSSNQQKNIKINNFKDRAKERFKESNEEATNKNLQNLKNNNKSINKQLQFASQEQESQIRSQKKIYKKCPGGTLTNSHQDADSSSRLINSRRRIDYPNSGRNIHGKNKHSTFKLMGKSSKRRVNVDSLRKKKSN